MKRVDPHKAWTIGIVVVVVLALFILLFYGRVLGAGQAANVGLNEVAVIDVTGGVGELVDVHIDVNSHQQLGVAGIVLNYDESVLEYDSVVPASGLEIIASNQPDVTVVGEVRFGLHGSTDDDTVVFNAVSVDRRLATVKFRIIVPTTTPSEITLTDDSIIDGGVTLVSGTVTGVLKSDGASCLLDNECSSGQCMLLVCNTDGDGDGVILANDCDDDDANVDAEISCPYDGSTCGSYALCEASCPTPPSEVCGNNIDEDCNPANDLCGLNVDCTSDEQCASGKCQSTCVENTPPVADMNNQLTLYGTPGESQTFTLAATDADANDVLTYSLPTSNNPTEGSATLAGDTVTYTFSENPTSGPHQLDYTIDDGYVATPVLGTFNLALEWCGDTVVNGGEFCDGADPNSQTCESQGFDSGTLSCTDTCTLDASGCVEAPAVVLGDVDGNGAISSLDAVEILKFSVDLLSNLAGASNVNGVADTNCDGSVSSLDAVEILKFSVDLITVFCE